MRQLGRLTRNLYRTMCDRVHLDVCISRAIRITCLHIVHQRHKMTVPSTDLIPVTCVTGFLGELFRSDTAGVATARHDAQVASGG